MTGRSSLDSGSRRSTVAISGQDTSVFLNGLGLGELYNTPNTDQAVLQLL
jgi:hypothetical protein